MYVIVYLNGMEWNTIAMVGNYHLSAFFIWCVY